MICVVRWFDWGEGRVQAATTRHTGECFRRDLLCEVVLLGREVICVVRWFDWGEGKVQPATTRHTGECFRRDLLCEVV